jgi:CHAT domain-containing protein
MFAKRWTRVILCGAAMGLVLSGCATSRLATTASGFRLGSNLKGEECSAEPNWTDRVYGDARVKPVRAFSVNCLGNTSSAVARVRIFDSAQARDAFTRENLLGADGGRFQEVPFEGFAAAQAQRFFDRALAAQTIVIETEVEGVFYQISAAENALAASHQALRIVAGIDTPDNASSDVNPFLPGSIARLPEGFAEAEVRVATGETLDSVLGRGTALNFRGLHADASRYLRSELANLPADADPVTEVALLLEAGLADSNLQFFAAAEEYFTRVETQLARLPVSDETTALRSKQRIYLALDALNRNDFAKALTILDRSRGGAPAGADESGLRDVNNLIVLNSGLRDGGRDGSGKPREADARSSLAIPQAQQFRASFLGVIEDWIRSVAELSRDQAGTATRVSATRIAKADRAISSAEKGLIALERSLEQSKIGSKGLLWLRARVLRQRGRVQAANSDFGDAIQSFDGAINALRGGAIASNGTGREPAIAELQLERATLFARSKAGDATIEREYKRAVDALIEARDDTTAISTELLQPYTDLLADGLDEFAANTNPSEAQRQRADTLAEQYFLALQIDSESGAARQLSELKNAIEQEAGVGEKLRELSELSRRRSQIDIEIADAGEGQLSESRLKELRDEQDALLRQYQAIDADLQGVARYNQVLNSPAKLAEIRDTLEANEAYVRFTVMGDRVFGVLVEKNGLRAIRPRTAEGKHVRLQTLFEYRDNIRDRIDKAASEYAVNEAFIMYRLLFLQVDEAIRRIGEQNGELIIDGGAVLAGINPAALVADARSVLEWRSGDRTDHSQVAFLAKIVPTSIAMSPRSFINSRKLPETSAPRDLIGFAATLPLEDSRSRDGGLQIGDCSFTPNQAQTLARQLAPIAQTEIDVAYAELGIARSRSIISDRAFSDDRVRSLGISNGELSQYKVLHFASHGLTEGALAQFGCRESPAALLTAKGAGAGSDLLLDIQEIAALRLKANLVVLSACETASAVGAQTARRNGEAQAGSTLEGMVRAFFAAEARAVMATYWQTPNTGASVDFMEAFYDAGREDDITTALNKAHLALISRKETSNPLYWGSFFVAGDTNNTMLQSAGAPLVAAR